MNRSSHRQTGLTLVEVIVATVILSMIMLATVTAMRTFGNTYERLMETTADTSEMREVHRFLRLAMRSAVGESDTFAGDPGSVAWATPLDRVGSAGGIQYLRLSRQGDALMLSFAPWDPARVAEADPQWGAVIDDFVLLDDVDWVEFAYRETPLSDWVSEYDGTQAATIPAAVSIRVGSGGREWPPIVVAPAGSGVL